MFKGRVSSWALAALCAAAGAAGSLALDAPAASADTVVYHLTGGYLAMPSSFFGMSIETSEVNTYESVEPSFLNAMNLIRPEDGSPFIYRIGGKSADRAYWDPPPGTKIPGGSFGIADAWMGRLKKIIQASDGRVLLDLNLAVHSTEMEDAYAKAGKQILGSDLIGVEIGNEPDLYDNQPYLDKEVVPGTYSKKGWPDHYDYSDYHSDWERYSTALRAAVPGVPIGGPEIISSKIPWLQATYGVTANDPNFLTIHRYPGSTCWPKTSKFYPTIAKLLAPAASTGIANTVADSMQFARQHNVVLRIDEANSISCGGNNGVANAFATALWAPDVLFSFAEEGVVGINWHTRPTTVNTPIAVTTKTIDGKKTAVMEPKPELYGLALFAQMTEHDDRIEATTNDDPDDTELKVWAMHEFDGMRVALLNKSDSAQTVELDFGNFNSGYLKRLTAPHINSTSGVTFGGQTIGTNGRWQGKLKVTKVIGHDGVWTVSLPAYSGGLLSLYR